MRRACFDRLSMREGDARHSRIHGEQQDILILSSVRRTHSGNAAQPTDRGRILPARGPQAKPDPPG